MHLDSPERAACIDFDKGLKVAHDVVANLFTDNSVLHTGTAVNAVFSKEQAEAKLSTINMKLLHRISSIPEDVQQCLWFVDTNRERFQRLVYGPIGECD